MIVEHWLCKPVLSVAVKTITCDPPCAEVGVQLNVLDTGFPELGNPGVMVAPLGRPIAFIVTVFPRSLSRAVTVKVSGLFATWSNDLPHVKPGVESKTGGVPGGALVRFSKKSTATCDKSFDQVANKIGRAHV